MNCKLSQQQQEAVIKRWHELRKYAKCIMTEKEPIRFMVQVGKTWGYINFDRTANVAFLEHYDLQLPTNDMNYEQHTIDNRHSYP